MHKVVGPGLLFHVLLVSIFCVVGPGVRAQEPLPSYDRIQAVVHGIRAAHETIAISAFLQGQADVIVCRMDHNTRNLMVQVPRESQISKAQFTAWLSDLGYQLACYSRVPEDGTNYPLLDPRACGLLSTGK